MARKEKRLRVPRASLAVSLLHDPEFMEMMKIGPKRDATLLYLLLIIAAKDQDNDGEFECSDAVLASMVHWPRAAFTKAVEELAQTDWIARKNGVLTIRSFRKWNPEERRGGARPGAGRPPYKDSESKPERNQTESPLHVETETVTDTEGSSVGSGGAGGEGATHPSRSKCTTSQAEAIYALYPRREGKQDALRKIKTAVAAIAGNPMHPARDDPLAFLQAAVVEYAASELVTTTPEKFIPHPATWFSQGRYDDDRANWHRSYDRPTAHDRSAGGGNHRAPTGAATAAAERRSGERSRMLGSREAIAVPHVAVDD